MDLIDFPRKPVSASPAIKVLPSKNSPFPITEVKWKTAFVPTPSTGLLPPLTLPANKSGLKKPGVIRSTVWMPQTYVFRVEGSWTIGEPPAGGKSGVFKSAITVIFLAPLATATRENRQREKNGGMVCGGGRGVL